LHFIVRGADVFRIQLREGLVHAHRRNLPQQNAIQTPHFNRTIANKHLTPNQNYNYQSNRMPHNHFGDYLEQYPFVTVECRWAIGKAFSKLYIFKNKATKDPISRSYQELF